MILVCLLSVLFILFTLFGILRSFTLVLVVLPSNQRGFNLLKIADSSESLEANPCFFYYNRPHSSVSSFAISLMKAKVEFKLQSLLIFSQSHHHQANLLMVSKLVRTYSYQHSIMPSYYFLCWFGYLVFTVIWNYVSCLIFSTSFLGS